MNLVAKEYIASRTDEDDMATALERIRQAGCVRLLLDCDGTLVPVSGILASLLEPAPSGGTGRHGSGAGPTIGRRS